LSKNSAHIDRLIARYLTGEASSEEVLLLEQWMEESPENKKYFGDIRFVHDKTVTSHKIIRVNTEKAWDTVKSQMKGAKKPVQKSEIKLTSLYKSNWIRIAASFTLIIGISAIVYLTVIKNTQTEQSITIAATDSIINQNLSGNTQVILNNKSTIIYTTKSSGKEREIQLTGEAFIKVKHSIDTTLIVKAEETFIKDIGTSFNVKAYPESNTIEVFVESGEVAFYTQEQKGIILIKGEKGIYEKDKKLFHKEIAETPNIISYSTKLFIFRNSKLSEVINALNAVYPETVMIDNPSVADCAITVTFDYESLSSIVDIIAETIGLQVIETENSFHLIGEQCLSH